MVVGGTHEGRGFGGRLCFDSAGCRIPSDRGAQGGSLLLRREGGRTDMWGQEGLEEELQGPTAGQLLGCTPFSLDARGASLQYFLSGWYCLLTSDCSVNYPKS